MRLLIYKQPHDPGEPKPANWQAAGAIKKERLLAVKRGVFLFMVEGTGCWLNASWMERVTLIQL